MSVTGDERTVPAVTAVHPSPMSSAQFVRDAHHIVRDLARERPVRYFGDFSLTILVAYAALGVYLTSPTWSPVQVSAFIVCGLAIYRGVVFIHEIAHRGRNFRGFMWLWNGLCGVPLFVPSFLYGDHKGHHSNQAYGTWADPEYILRSERWRLRVVVFLLLPIVYPLLAFLRFLLLTPIATLSRRADRVVWTYASSLFVMNETYRREYDSSALAPGRWVLELGCSGWAWVLTWLVITQRLPLSVPIKVYAVTLLWLAINQVRTLVAHRYRNNPNAAVDYVDQLLDTNTFARGKWLPELWAPVGLRYHALHHLLPTLPYHAMAAAHRRLMLQLPPDSPYHRTIRRGLWPTLLEMLRDPDRVRAVVQSAVAPTLSEDRRAAR